MPSRICPHEYIAIKLPSDIVKIEQVIPNTSINLGKYGSFQINQILGRPFYVTFEILDKSQSAGGHTLRIVPSAELHADALIDQESLSEDADAVEGAAVAESGISELKEILRSNKDTLDDMSSQKLSRNEIEALKQDATADGRSIITKLLQSHSTIDQKTAFSLAKYTLRKNKKHLKRFCIFPIDIPLMTEWLSDRDTSKIFDLRNETLGLMLSWANVHYSPERESNSSTWSGNWLVVDDTGGLVVGAVAERMGILHSSDGSDNTPIEAALPEDPPKTADGISETHGDGHDHPHRTFRRPPPAMSATSNTITLLHSNSQPNLSLLRYFSFDINTPPPSHPLYTRLKTISWLQLLDPNSDPVYSEPQSLDAETLSTLKSSKRSSYYRKRRRWERVRSVIDSTRAGNFDGLIIASSMHPTSVLRRTVPLLAGGAQVVVYSPYVEMLTEIVDLYSTARRTAFINSSIPAHEKVPSEDFPVDPTLLLTPTLQTARVRRWQVLPGRTHPLMTEKGGSEGYVLHSTRVLPAEGKVVARGQGPKRRKVDPTAAAVAADA
ncbi:MAG: hypothetical protein Q9227_007644 [Pyrenula ochraceoflavens]